MNYKNEKSAAKEAFICKFLRVGPVRLRILEVATCRNNCVFHDPGLEVNKWMQQTKMSRYISLEKHFAIPFILLRVANLIH